MNNTAIINALHAKINALHSSRSAWGRGVYAYACELLDDLSDIVRYDGDALTNETLLFKALLNGAADWNQYSWGGCSLCYDPDIAERLCNPTELKRCHGGNRKPNQREEWLDTQARALFQAGQLIRKAYREVAPNA